MEALLNAAYRCGVFASKAQMKDTASARTALIQAIEYANKREASTLDKKAK